MEDRLSYFSINWLSKTDGPGKRLVLFLQGCPLTCAWCHSPHSQSKESPLLYFDGLCVQCKRCETICKNSVHLFEDGKHLLKRDHCAQCGACVDACPLSSAYQRSGPLVLPTRKTEVSCLFNQLKPQLDFLKNGGGITFSGGEPLLQSTALTKLAKKCKEYGIHTALETSGIVPLSSLEKIYPYIDTWLLGMRLVTSKDTSNRNELEMKTRKTMNFLKNSDVIVRIPVIPGFTTTEAYLTIAHQILEDFQLSKIELLPLNPETSHYYEAMGQTSQIMYDETQSKQLFKYVSDFLGN